MKESQMERSHAPAEVRVGLQDATVTGLCQSTGILHVDRVEITVLFTLLQIQKGEKNMTLPRRVCRHQAGVSYWSMQPRAFAQSVHLVLVKSLLRKSAGV